MPLPVLNVTHRMKTVTVARTWRSVRVSLHSTRVILLIMLGTVILLVGHKVYRGFRKPKLPLIDYTGAWQSDPELITYIQKALLWPPNWSAYNLEDMEKEDFSDYGQSMELVKILKNKGAGFFIDARAGDGENGSISLYLERSLEWEGLLVEEDLNVYINLTKKNRGSTMLHAKLSTTETVTMNDIWNNTSMEVEPFEASWTLPLYSLILAMEVPQVDLLILNTMGTELEILQTLPWEEVKISVLCIDYTHMLDTKALTEYLRRQGYTLLKSHIKDKFFVSYEFLGVLEQKELEAPPAN